MEFKIGDKVFVNSHAVTPYLIGATGIVELIGKRVYGQMCHVRVLDCPLKPERADCLINMESTRIDWIPESNRQASLIVLNKEDVAC